MTAREHNKLLSILIFIQSGLTLLGGIMIVVVYAGMGTFLATAGREKDSQMVGGVVLIVGLIIGAVVFLSAVFYGFSAWKLYKEQSVGRILVIICCCLSLLSFPLGTALGIYGLWFLMGDLGKNFYSSVGDSMGSMPPPPPQSWQ